MWVSGDELMQEIGQDFWWREPRLLRITAWCEGVIMEMKYENSNLVLVSICIPVILK